MPRHVHTVAVQHVAPPAELTQNDVDVHVDADTDSRRMAQALKLAQHAIGSSDPNPRVGCVVADATGMLLAEGWTQAAGGHHAEAMALRQAQAAGRSVVGATAWVTLEPCAHFGRTPPCCDALIAAGIARVVVAMGDPNPRVGGQGLARLRAAGVQVDVLNGALADQAAALNIGFLSRMIRGRPWVRMKLAASMDGRTALPDGQSQWITSPEARADGHVWRKRAGAILTGIGTVLADDPRLDVRLEPTTLQPLKVILDSRLRLPASARLLASPGSALVVTGGSADRRNSAVLENMGVELVSMPDAAGRVDLHRLMAELAARQINEVHVEAGATLNGELLAAGLVDELLIYLAPVLLGAGPGLAALPALNRLDAAVRYRMAHTAQVGPDLRVVLRTAGALDWLR